MPSLVDLLAIYCIISFQVVKLAKNYIFQLFVSEHAKNHTPPKNPKLNDIYKLIIDSNSLINYLGFSYVYNHMTNHQTITMWKRLQHTGHSDESMS